MKQNVAKEKSEAQVSISSRQSRVLSDPLRFDDVQYYVLMKSSAYGAVFF